MSSFPPRNTPTKKVDIFERKVVKLLHSIKTNQGDAKISNASGEVRNAKINLIKAQLHLAKSYRDEGEMLEEKRKHKERLSKMMDEWKAKSI